MRKKKKPSKSVDGVTHMSVRQNWSLEAVVWGHADETRGNSVFFHVGVSFCVSSAEDVI